MNTKIEVFLSKELPKQYQEPTSGEAPVRDVDELIDLYANKYASFGDFYCHIYDTEDMMPFIQAINDLFASQGNDTKVDARLLKANINRLVPMIVVDGDIISQGVYPDLTALRGGANSINRGGTGAHGHGVTH